MTRIFALALLLAPTPLLAADAGPVPAGAPIEAPASASPSSEAQQQPPALPGEPTNVAEAISTGTQIYAAIKAGDWKLAVSLIIMLLIYVTRFFWKQIPKAVLEWLPAIIGTLAGFALALGSGASWGSAALEGFVIGSAANGLWAMVGKRLLGGKLPSAG